MATIPIDPRAFDALSASTAPYILLAGTNFPADGLAFPDTVVSAAYYQIPLIGTVGTVSVKLIWRAGATTGNWRRGLRCAAYTPDTDTASFLSKALTTLEESTVATTANANQLEADTFTLTSKDSAADGDMFVLEVSRQGDDAADTISGPIVLQSIIVDTNA